MAYFLAGVVLGALSWAVCPWVSGQFEPFDTSLGLAIGQMSMLMLAIYTGCTKSLGVLLLVLIGMYFGQNVYAYILGSAETRAWMLLGLLTTLFLCILPLIGGLLARWLSLYLRRGAENI